MPYELLLAKIVLLQVGESWYNVRQSSNTAYTFIIK